MSTHDEIFRKLTAEQNVMQLPTDALQLQVMRNQLTPILETLKSHHNNTIARLVDDAVRSNAVMSSALAGPIDDLRRAGLSEAARFGAARDAYQEFQSRFHLPSIQDASRLINQLESSGLALAMRHAQAQNAALQQRFDAMRAPWLDMQNKLHSIGGFVELQRIGMSLRDGPSFDSEFVDRLRLDLGDWRLPIDWPPAIFTDIAARTAFYVDRGLDTRLTDFPTDAFQESSLLAGLKEPWPPLLEGYYPPTDEREQDHEETGFRRTNHAYDQLLRFETQLRRFIDQRMRTTCGEDWVKHRVPGEMRKHWTEKKQKALDTGTDEWPLIAYADFTDYVSIITQGNNWRDVFKDVFRSADSIRESLQRLYPIRLCTMHARLITQDDQLYLYVETRRILSAIGAFL